MHPPFCSRVELHKGWCSNTPGYLWVPWRLEGCDYHLRLSEKNPSDFAGGHSLVQAAAGMPQDFWKVGCWKKPIDIRILSLKGI